MAKKSFSLGSVTKENQTKQADAIVVLGAAVWKRGEPSPALRRRVLHAVDLMREGRSHAMLVTGGLGKYPPTEAEVMKEIAVVGGGIPPESIIMENKATSTFQSFPPHVVTRYFESGVKLIPGYTSSVASDSWSSRCTSPVSHSSSLVARLRMRSRV